VVSNPGGLFYGREGIVRLIDPKRTKVWVGLEFTDEGTGADRFPWWFERGEVEPATEGTLSELQPPKGTVR